jgi:hypothetical protein
MLSTARRRPGVGPLAGPQPHRQCGQPLNPRHAGPRFHVIHTPLTPRAARLLADEPTAAGFPAAAGDRRPR